MGVRQNLRFVVQRLLGGRGSPATCAHLAQMKEPPRGERLCPPCVARGDRWVHLRQCMSCGQVGCCDSSRNKHASRHAGEAGHPIARSLEPGETWLWCYLDEVLIEPRKGK